MRILIFAALYYPFEGGYADSIHEMAKGLLKRGHQVLVLTCNTHQQPVQDIRDGVVIWQVSCWNPSWLNETFPIPRPLSLLKVIKKLNQESFDVVSTQTRFFPTSWCGFLFAKFKKIPIVHTERGSQHTVSDNFFISATGKIIDHTFGWLVCRFSNQVVGVSEAACVFVRHLGAKNPIKIYNGIDCDFWQLPPSNLRSSQDLNFEITFVGRLIEAKGVQDLLRTFKSYEVQPRTRKIKVNVIGDGSYRYYLENLARELGVSDRVKFWGRLKKEKIREIFSRTAVFVNSSYSEGLPRCVLEAGAAGLPILTTDVGGTGEIVNNDCGIMVSPQNVELLAEKINLLLNDKDLRKRLAANVRERVKENFSLAKIVLAYEKIYSDPDAFL